MSGMNIPSAAGVKGGSTEIRHPGKAELPGTK